MQDELMEKTDHDDGEINPIMAEVQASVAGKDPKKEKTRRYWTPQEEQCLYECWGRDNWRLTRHGKNTRFFAQWSEELKEKHNLDIKPEEIQAKVNTTRAKFRSVKKNPRFDKYNPTWKKFDLIDKLLKNKYRPKDAEPIPADASRENRDVSSNSEDEEDFPPEPSRELPATPNSLTSNSQDTNTVQQQGAAQGVIMNTDQINNSSLSEHDVSVNLFNANELQPNPNYGNQLYTEIKEEFIGDYTQQSGYATQYTPDQNHFTPGIQEEQPQLLELQTPQQQLQHHQQQLQTPQHYNNIVASSSNYDHHSVGNNAAVYTSSADAMNLYNSQQHYSTTTMAPSTPMQTMSYNNVVQPYINNGNVNANSLNNHNNNNNNNININNGNNNGVMQPPLPTTTIAPRKRGRQPGSLTNHSKLNHTSTEPSLESMYLEEVRKKNVILDEQKEIARKRLHVEERQVQLMEHFFPKCLEMQIKILDKLLFNSKSDNNPNCNTDNNTDNNLVNNPDKKPDDNSGKKLDKNTDKKPDDNPDKNSDKPHNNPDDISNENPEIKLEPSQ